MICRLALGFVLITLTACTSFSSHFDCPQTAGISCQSLDQINRLIDQERFVLRHQERVTLC